MKKVNEKIESPEIENALATERETKAIELSGERSLKTDQLDAERSLKTEQLLAERDLKTKQLADKDKVIAQKNALILKLEQEIARFKGMGFIKRMFYK